MNQASEIFRDEAIAWSVLTSTLEKHPGTRGRSAEIYARLARSFAATAAALQQVADAGPSTEADAPNLHTAWRTIIDHDELHEARNRALGERWRLLAIAAMTPRSRWSDTFAATLRTGTLEAYSDSLAELTGATSLVAEPR